MSAFYLSFRHTLKIFNIIETILSKISYILICTNVNIDSIRLWYKEMCYTCTNEFWTGVLLILLVYFFTIYTRAHRRLLFCLFIFICVYFNVVICLVRAVTLQRIYLCIYSSLHIVIGADHCRNMSIVVKLIWRDKD